MRAPAKFHVRIPVVTRELALRSTEWKVKFRRPLVIELRPPRKADVKRYLAAVARVVHWSTELDKAARNRRKVGSTGLADRRLRDLGELARLIATARALEAKL